MRVTEVSWPSSATPVVSICCITYNHERFIRDCLDGFLMQETRFPVEVLIHDDASTDDTATIIREYEARFPNLIKPIYQTENQYSKKIRINRAFNYPRAKGKYIASCEGDDYWITPNKLQTQVDFMEAHPDYSACFHNVYVRYEDGSRDTHPIFPAPLKARITIQDLAAANCVPNLSKMFRTGLVSPVPEWYLGMPIGDWPLHVLHAEHGDFGYIDEILAVYRVHAGGVWSRLSEAEGQKVNIQVAEAIDAHLGFKYTRAIRRNVALWHYRIALILSETGDQEGAASHLRASLRNCLVHEEIPKKRVFSMLLQYSWPALYVRLKRVQRALRGIPVV